jgi:hypothetical protein
LLSYRDDTQRLAWIALSAATDFDRLNDFKKQRWANSEIAQF